MLQTLGLLVVARLVAGSRSSCMCEVDIKAGERARVYVPCVNSMVELTYEQLERGMHLVGPDIAELIFDLHREAHDLSVWKRGMGRVNEELKSVMFISDGFGRGYKLVERCGVAVGCRFIGFDFGPLGGWNEWGTRAYIFTALQPGDHLPQSNVPARDQHPTLCIYELRHGADLSLPWS